MGTLKLHTSKLRLSKTEQAKLERSLRDLVSRSSKQRTKELDERFRRRRRFGQLLGAELNRVGFDDEKLRRFASQEYARLDKAFMARVKGRRETRVGRRRGDRPAVVVGHASGTANPPYDFTWTHHNIIGADPGFNYHTANPNTGLLRVFGDAHDSRPTQVDSFAGLGFWYIPDRVGVLSVSMAPPVDEYGNTMALWNDVASTAGWISLGMLSYPRNPPGFTEVSVVDRDLLWEQVVYWFEDIAHKQNRPAYSMSVSTPVDTSHNYACQAWIEASTLAANGGHAQSRVEATVGSFTYTFV